MKNFLIRNNLRKFFRDLRKKQTLQQQRISANKITDNIINNTLITKTKNIAIFISYDNEIDTNILIEKLIKDGKKIYLPIIQYSKQSKRLLFSEYTKSTVIIKNKFNIQEPKFYKNSLISIKELDILFVPLVTFDKFGNRLGMGGGFYDYTLKNWKTKSKSHIIGLAYDCQFSQQNIPIEPWDIPLPEIVTPSYHLKNLVK